MFTALANWLRNWRKNRTRERRFNNLGWDAKCQDCGQWLHEHENSQCIELDKWKGDGGDLWVYRCGHCQEINRIIPGLLPCPVHEHEVAHWIAQQGGESGDD